MYEAISENEIASNYAKSIVFKDDEEIIIKEDEIEVMKVKVKWNEFIKMKKKKFSDDYYVLEEIGKGGFGSVYKVTNKSNLILRAAKRINKRNLKDQEHESLLN